MKTAIYFLLLVFAACACSSSNNEPAPQVPPMPSEATHTLQEVFRISEFREGLFMHYLRQLEFLSNGNIIVRQSRTPYLLELTPDRKLLNKIGREGRGPGEFSSIDQIVITPGDSLHVFDTENARQQIFIKNSSGKWMVARTRIIKRENNKEFLVDFPLKVYPFDPSAYMALLANRIGIRDTTTAYYNFLAEVDHNLNQTGPMKLLKPVQDAAVYRKERSMGADYRYRYMRGFYFYLQAEEEVVYITNTSNRINIFDLNGNKRVAGYLPYQQLPLSEVVDEDLRRLAKIYEPGRMELIRSTYLDHEPLYWDFFLDDRRLWVHFSRKDSTAPDWATATLSGDIRAAFNGPENFNAVAVHESRIYGTQRVDGIPYLASYQLSEL